MRTSPLNPIRKAVIPAAGLGTRMLPFTKVVPKEMLPIVNKPLIQYAIEEAVSSGIEEIVLVTAPGKHMMLDYFSRDPELEEFLQRRNQNTEAELIRSIARLCKLQVVSQDQPRGLGDAIRCARAVVGEEPFAVILPDVLIVAASPCLRQLIDCFNVRRGCYVATREVRAEETHRFGILRVSPVSDTPWNGRLFSVQGLVEKPTKAAAPSRYGILGRYLLEPDIFAYLERTPEDHNGEVQITDALALYCRAHALYGFCFEGAHYDVGNRLGLLQASVEFGLNDPEVGQSFRKYLDSLVK